MFCTLLWLACIILFPLETAAFHFSIGFLCFTLLLFLNVFSPSKDPRSGSIRQEFRFVPLSLSTPHIRPLLTLYLGQGVPCPARHILFLSHKTASTMAIDDMETVDDAYSCSCKILYTIPFTAHNTLDGIRGEGLRRFRR